MGITEYTVAPVPREIAAPVRQFLDDQFSSLEEFLLNVPHVDQDETITGEWTFDSDAHFNSDIHLASAIALNSPAGGYFTFDEDGDVRIVVDHIDSRFTIGDGYRLRIRNSGNTDHGDFYHDGTDFISDFLNTTDWNVTGISALHLGTGVDFLFVDGKEAIDGNDTWLRLNQNSDFSSGVYTPSLMYANAGVRLGVNQDIEFDVNGSRIQGWVDTINDDATQTFVAGQSFGIWFVQSQYDDSHTGIMAVNGTSISTIFSGSNNQQGDGGVNPDIDTDTNMWMSASGTLSVKNRVGSSREYVVFFMGT